MSDAVFPRCCAECWHSADRPCPELVDCLSQGPLCHAADACSAQVDARNRARRRESPATPVIFVGTGTCGLGAGAGKTLAAIRSWLAAGAVDADVVEVGCIGLCVEEPLVDIQLPGRPRLSFARVTDKKVAPLMSAVFSGLPLPSEPLGQFRQDGAAPWPGVRPLDEHPFFAPQTRWVLANCGVVDPSSIDEYLARGGYGALAKALRHDDAVGGVPRHRAERAARARRRRLPDRHEVDDRPQAGGRAEVHDLQRRRGRPGRVHGPRGHGGRSAPRARRPGARRVRHRREQGVHLHPRRVSAGHRAGSRRRSRRRRPTACSGTNILDTGFSLDIVVKQGAGAFVCGEETALIHSIEGRRGMPRPRPPFPAVSGLFGKPTVINNVETLANVPGIVANGAAWFGSVGTASSKGTKVFALSGNVARTGLVEVAMGTPLRQIVFDIGGGIPGDRAYKAVQIGGPSGGCIPASQLDIEIDYESLKKVGAMMGSGGLVVMDDGNLHGGRGEVLHGLHPEGELRQVHPVPRGHPPHARDPREPDRRDAASESTSMSSSSRRWSGSAR